jgi:CTP-dependent riboflavin kinase
MADPDLQARLRRLFGFDPVPGTLNVMLPEPLPEPLASYVGWTDLGFSEDDPLVPGRRGLRYGFVLIEGQYQGIAFQGDEPEYPSTQIELISDRHLRDTLALRNLDRIHFQIQETSADSATEHAE